MLGHSFQISVPRATLTDISSAIDHLGGDDSEVFSVVVRVGGDIEALLMAVFSPEQAANLCMTLGIEVSSEMGQSVLQEVGNVLACAYADVLSQMSGVHWDVHPPDVMHDMLGSIITSLFAVTVSDIDNVLLIDSTLAVNSANTGNDVLFVPVGDGIQQLLGRLGVAPPAARGAPPQRARRCLQRRVVEEGIGVGVEDLVREDRRLRRLPPRGSSPEAPPAEHPGEPLDVHQLGQAVARVSFTSG